MFQLHINKSSQISIHPKKSPKTARQDAPAALLPYRSRAEQDPAPQEQNTPIIPQINTHLSIRILQDIKCYLRQIFFSNTEILCDEIKKARCKRPQAKLSCTGHFCAACTRAAFWLEAVLH